MELNIQKYRFDIQTSINSIHDYIGEKRDFVVYKSDKKLRRAVERELEIIGEATNKLLLLKPDIEIESARKIVDLRNLVIHTYDKVDDAIVWGILIKHLLILKEQVDNLIGK